MISSRPIQSRNWPRKRDRVYGAVHLLEGKVRARAVVLVPVHGVNGLMQAAAKRHVQLLKSPANGEERLLALDRGSDQRKGQRVAHRIEPILHERRFVAVMLRCHVRPAARQKDGIRDLKQGRDIGHAGGNEQRLAFGDIGDGGRIFAADGIEDVTVDQLGTRRNDDDRTAHAAISPATSFSVRSSARRMTLSASSNCASVQIRGGAITIVSNTARMMKPSRKK